jgi:transcription initiation factor TFIIF subunit beta
MSALNIKAEPAVKIKSELGMTPPELKQEMGYADDDDYEDAGDLDMALADRAVWLVKLPSFIAERWKDIDEDEEIVLGVVRVNPNDQSNVYAFLAAVEAR